MAMTFSLSGCRALKNTFNSGHRCKGSAKDFHKSERVNTICWAIHKHRLMQIKSLVWTSGIGLLWTEAQWKCTGANSQIREIKALSSFLETTQPE